MNNLYLILSFFLLLNCENSIHNETSHPEFENLQNSEIEDQQISEPNWKIGLAFINKYVEFCNSRTPEQDILNWVKSSELTSKDFVSSLSNLIMEAEKKDPFTGLDYDPLFIAQDYPEEGFVIESTNTEHKLMIVRGIEWDSFTVKIHLKMINQEWVVDAAGDVNPQAEN